MIRVLGTHTPAAPDRPAAASVVEPPAQDLEVVAQHEQLNVLDDVEAAPPPQQRPSNARSAS